MGEEENATTRFRSNEVLNAVIEKSKCVGANISRGLPVGQHLVRPDVHNRPLTRFTAAPAVEAREYLDSLFRLHIAVVLATSTTTTTYQQCTSSSIAQLLLACHLFTSKQNVQFTASKIVPITFQKMTDRLCFQTAVASSRGVAGSLLIPAKPPQAPPTTFSSFPTLLAAEFQLAAIHKLENTMFSSEPARPKLPPLNLHKNFLFWPFYFLCLACIFPCHPDVQQLAKIRLLNLACSGLPLADLTECTAAVSVNGRTGEKEQPVLGEGAGNIASRMLRERRPLSVSAHAHWSASKVCVFSKYTTAHKSLCLPH
ncbi:hypothetical protein T4D_11941 [Trichinella pseudospiralis]|uniref:Uncharacterized protein n=1 Tax=Trichinella pseudospiralis TaxID=6337 RepID=A0A0V1FUP0_TRIPS|nr:hypothetical protein T4D_11941 [Trichinella pseudospiralis]